MSSALFGPDVRLLVKLLLAFFSFFFCMSAVADQFYLTAGLYCNPSKPALVVTFRGSWNVTGEAVIANLRSNEVDPRKLVAFSQDKAGKYSISARSESKVCRMGGQDYTVEFSPLLAQRFHPEGFCATRIGASVSIRLHGEVVASAGVDACTEEGMVTKSVSLSPKREPIYEQVDARKFYAF